MEHHRGLSGVQFNQKVCTMRPSKFRCVLIHKQGRGEDNDEARVPNAEDIAICGIHTRDDGGDFDQSD